MLPDIVVQHGTPEEFYLETARLLARHRVPATARIIATAVGSIGLGRAGITILADGEAYQIDGGGDIVKRYSPRSPRGNPNALTASTLLAASDLYALLSARERIAMGGGDAS